MLVLNYRFLIDCLGSGNTGEYKHNLLFQQLCYCTDTIDLKKIGLHFFCSQTGTGTVPDIKIIFAWFYLVFLFDRTDLDRILEVLFKNRLIFFSQLLWQDGDPLLCLVYN